MKVCFIGEANVGKTTICNELLNKNRELTTTIGLEFNSLRLGDNIFEIFDTAGQERYRSLIPMYLRKANIIIYVIDSNNINEESLNYWYNYIEEHCYCKNILLILTKCDLIKPTKEKLELINYFFNGKTIIKRYNKKISHKIIEYFLNIEPKKKPRKVYYEEIPDDILTKKNISLLTGEDLEKYDYISKKPKCCK